MFGNYKYRDTRKDTALHTKTFTGHEWDDTTGLVYAHARYLDTKAHTFLSVDPMLYKIPVSYLTDPQQMNSYAYARNNPVTTTDPDGKFINILAGAVIGAVISGGIAAYNGASPLNIAKAAGAGFVAGGVAAATFGISMLAVGSLGMNAYLTTAVSVGMANTMAGITSRSLTGQQVFSQSAITRDMAVGSGASIAGVAVAGGVSVVSQAMSRAGSYMSQAAGKGLTTAESSARFTQTSVSPNFSSRGDFSGQTVNGMVSGLKDGSIKPSSLPINYINGNNGVRLVDNNRSAYALQQAGIPESQWNWQKGARKS